MPTEKFAAPSATRALAHIGEFVEIDNETVRWALTGPSEVDVLSFQDAMAELSTAFFQ